MQSDFLYLVETELVAMREKHQEPMLTAKDYCRAIRLGAIRLFNAIETQGDRREILDELVQIAATCYRAAEDLALIEVAEAKKLPSLDGWPSAYPRIACRDCGAVKGPMYQVTSFADKVYLCDKCYGRPCDHKS